MSLSDVILGKRHLLGFVIPGTILVVAAVIGTGEGLPEERFRAIATPEWIAIIVVGLLAGHAFGHPNFRVATWLSEALHRLPLAIHDERTWMAETRGLVARARALAAEVVGDPAEVGAWSDDRLFDFCKLALVEKTRSWSAKLDDRETEINLLAMNVIPTFALLATWAIKSGAASGSWSGRGVVVPVVGLLFPLFLLRNIQPLRARERQVVFEMFLELPVLGRLDGPCAVPDPRRDGA